jgi:hypothetical protein
VFRVPLVGWGPLQPPDAVQLFALSAFHFSVVACPMATLLGFDCRVTVGVAAPELGVNATGWLQATSDVNTMLARVQRTRHELRRTKLNLRLPDNKQSGYAPHMSNASSHNVDARMVIQICKLANLSPIEDVADLRQAYDIVELRCGCR